MDGRHRRALADGGQALAEVPVVVVATVLLTLTLIQPALSLIAKIVVSQAARESARVAATCRDGGDPSADELLQVFARERVSILGAVPALMVPNSLSIQREGTTRAAMVSVRIQIKQRPLPIVGWVFSRGAPEITIAASAQAPGGESWVQDGSPRGEVIVGAVQEP